MSFIDLGSCYNACNQAYGPADPGRLFCKKACDNEGTMSECKAEFCPSMCIKEELGESEEKYGSWSKVFSRAPGKAENSEHCMSACFLGCANLED